MLLNEINEKVENKLLAIYPNGVYNGDMGKKVIFLFLFFIMTFSDLVARAISYPGAWTLMLKTNQQFSRLHYHYSPKISHSVGLVLEKDKPENTMLYHLQNNILLLRHNTKKSQRNVYLKIQAGWAEKLSRKAESYRLSLDGDWESRRHFVSYHVNANSRGYLKHPYLDQQIRVGVAPYVADYGSFHTWVFVEINHYPSKKRGEDHLLYRLVFRFFKGLTLLEVGIDRDNKGMLSVMRRL